MYLNAVASLVLYLSAKYLAAGAVEDIKTVIVALQPVALALRRRYRLPCDGLARFASSGTRLRPPRGPNPICPFGLAESTMGPKGARDEAPRQQPCELKSQSFMPQWHRLSSTRDYAAAVLRSGADSLAYPRRMNP
jgi:hypothetical protein